MIWSSTANGNYKRRELRWVRNLHQIMLICFWQSERKKNIRKMRPKTLSVLEVPGWYFYNLGTIQGRILQLRKAPLDNPTVTGSDSSQDLTPLVNALDEVYFISISMIVLLSINQAILLLGQCTRSETWKGMPLKG